MFLFLLLFLPTLFIPIFPLNKLEKLVAIYPCWRLYQELVSAPEYFFIFFPFLFSQFFFAFFVSSTLMDNIRFFRLKISSLLQLSVIVFMSFTAMIQFGPLGYATFFYFFVTFFLIAQPIGVQTIAGFPTDRVPRSLRILLALCCGCYFCVTLPNFLYRYFFWNLSS